MAFSVANEYNSLGVRGGCGREEEWFGKRGTVVPPDVPTSPHFPSDSTTFLSLELAHVQNLVSDGNTSV